MHRTSNSVLTLLKEIKKSLSEHHDDPDIYTMNVSLEQGRIVSLSPRLNNLASYGGLHNGYFITVGCIVLENKINYIITSS